MTDEEIKEVGKITFFNRTGWYKKKNICSSCQGSGEVGGQFCGGQWFTCDVCNGDGKWHEQS